MTLGLFLLIILLFVAPFIIPVSDSERSNTLVSVSTFPLYDITTKVARNKAHVMMVIPFGTDIHTFEPTPKDRVNLQKSKLFIFSGKHLEPWAASFQHHNRVDMSYHVNLKPLCKDEHEGHEHHHHEAEADDPHYWLDIDNMIASVKVITKELSTVDPASQAFFETNAQVYIKELEQLKQEYKQKLSTCKKDIIIVNHNAFGYLSSEYGFHVKSLSGFSTDALPSAQNMKILIDTVNEHNISTIFFEPFSSDRLMQTVANEGNTAVGTLHPLANITHDEAAVKKSYIAIMRENLEKLSTALECQ